MSSPNITLLINAEDRASQVLSKVQKDINKAQDSIVKGNQKIIESTKKLNTNILGAASSFAAFGAGATALYTSLSNLDKAQLRVASAQKEVTSAQATALQAQLSYQRAVEKFGATSEQAEQALLRLQAAEEQLKIAHERVALAQNDLSDTYANFAANLAPQIISLTIGMQGAFRALGITSVAQLAPSIRAVGIALKGAFITNPVGLAVIGIGTAVALLATNTLGLRDRIVELGNTIIEFIDKHLKPLGDAIRFVIDAMKPVSDFFATAFASDMEKSSNAIDSLRDVSTQSFSDIEESMLGFNNSSNNILANIEEATKGFTDAINKSIFEAENSIKATSSSINDNLDVSIETFDLFGNTAIDASLKIDTLANITDASMKNISNSIKENASIIVENNEKIIRSIEEASLVLASGSSASSLGKARKSGVIELSDGFITPGGTIVRGELTSNTTVLKKEVIEGIRSGTITRVTADDYIKAQHGFEGLVTKPTLFLAGEAGPEHVKIEPNSTNALKLVVEFVDESGNSLGSQTLDLANKEAKLRLKAKGVRLF